MVRAFLVDFDGTIADTETRHYEAFAEALARRGVALSTTEYFERYLGLTDRECVERCLAAAGRYDLQAEADGILEEKTRAMAAELARGVAIYPGVADFLHAASQVGPLAVVSGALFREVESVLWAAGLRHLFTAVVAAEDVMRGKPDPEAYVLGWRRIRDRALPPLELDECLAVEDAPTGIRAARAAGARTLAIAHTRPRAELSAADLVIGSFLELDWEAIRSLG